MDLFTALLFTTTFKNGETPFETVVRLKDISECRLVLKERSNGPLRIISSDSRNTQDMFSARVIFNSVDEAYINLQCIDLTKGKKND